MTDAKYKDSPRECTLGDMSDISLLPVTIAAILVALTVHEASHAFAAKRLGDDTAESMGRLTLNPLAHLDPLGAILFVLVGFGWAKPVPVDARNFRHPVRDAALVAFAGPLSNLLLAFIAFVALPLLGMDGIVTGDGSSPAWLIVESLLVTSVHINLVLMAFNLLPVPPLDGSNILRLFIPWRLRDRYEEYMQYGPWILLVILLSESFLGVSVLGAWVNGISNVVLDVFEFVLGA